MGDPATMEWRDDRGVVPGGSRGSLTRSGPEQPGPPWDATSRLGLMFFCAALYIGLGIKYANFLTADDFFITLLSVTSIGFAAIGMTALLISGNVDLSIGGQYAFISMVTAIVARDSQNTALAILTGLACGTALGYTNGRLVRLLRINPLIVTLGVGIVLHGFAFVICSGLSVYGFPGRFVRLGQTSSDLFHCPSWSAGSCSLSRRSFCCGRSAGSARTRSAATRTPPG